MTDSLQPYGLYSSWYSPGQNTGVGSLFLLQGDLLNPGIKPRSPVLQADSLPAEPHGKPKNTGMGSLSLLQQIIQTRESNWSLLHRRWILYQLSYQGSPNQVGWRKFYKAILMYLFCLVHLEDYYIMTRPNYWLIIYIDSQNIKLCSLYFS